ncbi:hypothetical protein HDU99_004241, partial [Rhizoclosmatium hyalinum]
SSTLYTGIPLGKCNVTLIKYQAYVTTYGYSAGSVSSNITCTSGILLYSSAPLNTGPDKIISDFWDRSQWFVNALVTNTSVVAQFTDPGGIVPFPMEGSVSWQYGTETPDSNTADVLLTLATSFTVTIAPEISTVVTNNGLNVTGLNWQRMVALGESIIADFFGVGNETFISTTFSCRSCIQNPAAIDVQAGIRIFVQASVLIGQFFSLVILIASIGVIVDYTQLESAIKNENCDASDPVIPFTNSPFIRSEQDVHCYVDSLIQDNSSYRTICDDNQRNAPEDLGSIPYMSLTRNALSKEKQI